MDFTDTLQSLERRRIEIDAAVAALQAEYVDVCAAHAALTKLLAREPAAVPEPPAAPVLVKRPERVDVAGRSPDPFAFNGTCVVCEKGFHKNGPRQTVCRECRKMDPRVSVEALKALYAQRATASATAEDGSLIEACVGPAIDGATPCPLGKNVTRKPQARGPIRCPDCHLEVKRRGTTARLQVKRRIDKALESRISKASPPAQTIDGQIVRRVRKTADDDEYETVWNGGEGLSSDALGSSLGRTR